MWIGRTEYNLLLHTLLRWENFHFGFPFDHWNGFSWSLDSPQYVQSQPNFFLTSNTIASKHILKKPRICINWKSPFQTLIYYLVKVNMTQINYISRNRLHKLSKLDFWLKLAWLGAKCKGKTLLIIEFFFTLHSYCTVTVQYWCSVFKAKHDQVISVPCWIDAKIQISSNCKVIPWNETWGLIFTSKCEYCETRFT